MTKSIEQILGIPPHESYRRTLQKIRKQYGDFPVSDDLAQRIVEGTINKAEMYRVLTDGRGVDKAHDSANYDTFTLKRRRRFARG